MKIIVKAHLLHKPSGQADVFFSMMREKNLQNIVSVLY